MIKIVPSGSFDFGMPAASLMQLWSGGIDRDYMQKRASAHINESLIRNLKPEDGHSFIHLISMGAHEAYGCFPAGTEVRMGDGDLKTIELVQQGDEVVTHRGRVKPVVQIFQRLYSGETTKLAVSGVLTDIVSTANHKYYVIKKDQVTCRIDKTDHCKPGTCQKSSICRRCERTTICYEPEWVEAQSIGVGDYVLSPVPDRGVGKRTWEWSPALAKLMGYFIAEGSYLKNGRQGKDIRIGLCFSFGLYETETVVAQAYQCAMDLKAEYKTLTINGPYIDTEKGTATLHLRCPELATRVFRTVGEYSGGKQLNGEVYSQQPELLALMVAGYVDGDGSNPVYTKPNGYAEHRYICTTKSRRLALDLQWVLSRLNCEAAVCQGSGDNTMHYVSFSNAAGEFLKDKAFKHRSEPADQVKQHSFAWNGYICRPVRAVSVNTETLAVYNMEVEDDHSYTVGNGIAVKNCNRNGDGFNEKRALWSLPQPKEGLANRVMMGDGLMKYHSTFTKRGHVFKHHKNDDPSKSIGSIHSEAYNPDMRRGELIIKVANDHPDWRDDLNNLAKGKDIPYSMACKIAADLCTICGNRARHKREYCEHANDLTSMWKTGHVNFVMNDEPIFFDISKVFRPADRIAYSLQKVASDESMSGVDLAKAAGLETAPYWLEAERPAGASRFFLQKLALAKKLAELEKTIDVVANGADNTHLSALSSAAPTKPLPASAMKSLATVKTAVALRGLTDHNICLSMPDFFDLVMGTKVPQEEVKKEAALVPNIFGRQSEADMHDVAAAADYDQPDEIKGSFEQMIACSLRADYSLDMAHAVKRAELSALRQAKPVFIKRASDQVVLTKRAEYLSKEYAKYVLSFVHANASKPGTNELTVLQRYIRV